MSAELTELTARKLAQLMRERKVSPSEVIEAHLSRIEQLNPKLNAIITLADDALERAREAEAAVMRGDEVGALRGVPVTIKDTIETKGLLTTAGSKLLSANLPNEDAPTVARLKSAGAIILGKTNVPEMAIPYECDNPVFGRTNNPFDLTKTSGGSSGGEAAAIAACLSPAGLGSDLSGSIRVPAHFCGIVGLKPTPGRISSAGHIPKAEGALWPGAVIGPMARRVEDLSLMLEALTERNETETARVDLVGSSVGVSLNEEYAPISDETLRAIKAAAAALTDAGLVVIEEKPPCIKRAIDLWPELYSAPAAIQLRDFYQGHEEQAGKAVRSILAASEGHELPSLADHTKVWDEGVALREELLNWMKKTRLILMPVGAATAFDHGARRVDVDGQSISVFRAFGYSRAANVLGFPAVTIPAGRSSQGLPIGVQLIGRPFEEETLLAAASLLEESLGGWTPPKPK
jgi:Asp-tRNA(Asn)/Glu-tRNA(Gln) amidotransferase A subunit family amidase